MSRITEPLKIYKNQELMDRYNEMQVRIKTHLFNLGDEKFKSTYPKPTVEEMDKLMIEVMQALKKDNEPMIKH